MQPACTARFMSIPYELREKIYVNVFEEAELFGHLPFVGDQRAEKSARIWFWSLNMNVNVLRVSIQVHNEALPLLKTAVHLKISDTRVDIADVPWTIRRYLPYIERLTLYTGMPPNDVRHHHYHGFVASCLPKLKFLTVRDKIGQPSVPGASLQSDFALDKYVDTIFSKTDKDHIETWIKESCNPQTRGLNWLSTLFTKPSSQQPTIAVRIDRYHCQLISVHVPGVIPYFMEASFRIRFDFMTRKVLPQSLEGVTRRFMARDEYMGKENYTWAVADTKEQMREWLRRSGN